MAKCFRCQAETELYSNGVPVCVKCVDELEPTPQKPQAETRESQPKDGKAA